MWSLLILLVNLILVSWTKVLNVGLLSAYKDTALTPFIGWKQTAGAVGVAWDKIQSDRILPDYDTLKIAKAGATWVPKVVETPPAALKILGEALEQKGAREIVPSPKSLTWAMGDCIESADAGAVIDWIESGTNVVLGPACSACSQAQTLMRLFKRYRWKEVAVMYYSSRSDLIPRCSLIISDLETLMNNNANTTMTYRRQLQNITNSTFKNVLSAIREVSRITVVCLESDEARRNLFVAIAEEGMDTDEYMWLMIDSQPLNASTQFIADIIAKMQQPPFNCSDCTSIDPGFSQVGELADAMMLYALTLNRSIAAGFPNPTGTELVHFSKGTFEGFSGTVIINNNFTRDPVFLVYGLDPSDQPIVLMKILEQLDNDSIALIQEVQSQSVIWANHGGSPPRNRPKCDFDGSACPLSFVRQYLAITLVAAIVPVIIIVAAVFFIMRFRRLEEERLNGLWQIPFITLAKPNVKNPAYSSRSLQSTITTSTKLTIDSKKDTQRHAFFLLGDDSVVARKHHGRPVLKKADCASLRKVKADLGQDS
ncbi:ligand-binding protein, receptor family [Ancylostoma duodenale]|uniref:Ligand-binding protein, receptor family n=1 Tax=Ancylostoma duodenale TaxID=51022 RepID=A0A0C2D877_9BILA|nr:ligand-binding protein, receptor family [Ancylostoma duodenale]